MAAPPHNFLPGSAWIPARAPASRRRRISRLAAAVDAYETDMAKLVQAGFDPHAYGAAEAGMAEVRAHGLALPEFTVAALELSIAHAEVMALLWERGSRQAGWPGDIGEAQQRRRSACRTLQQACLEELCQPDA